MINQTEADRCAELRKRQRALFPGDGRRLKERTKRPPVEVPEEAPVPVEPPKAPPAAQLTISIGELLRAKGVRVAC